jgi:hypothetical protein
MPSLVVVRDASPVAIEGIRFHQAGVPPQGKLLPGTVVRVTDSTVMLKDCAIVGSPGNGLLADAGADVSIEHCLIAAAWNTGIRCGSNSKVVVTDSDVRNCHYSGIVAARGGDLEVTRSRISGAAWHGIRYDKSSPEIIGNLIFSNARSGINASGPTKAQVRENVFFGNEMNGMS